MPVEASGPRGPIGKADSAGSCLAPDGEDDFCGGVQGSGACWCDDLCTKYGDCCSDYTAICVDPDVPPDTNGEAPGASLPPGWENSIDPLGCSDIHVYAANDDDTLSLSVWLSRGLAGAAVDSQETFTGEFDVSEFGQLSVLVGEALTESECNDTLQDATLVEQEWVAQSGSVTLTVVPEADNGFDSYSTATLTFNDVVFAYEGSSYAVDELILADVAVGWRPG